MSSYQELVKNFEKIRSYMREFYLYGLKSRREYNNKSARSYDDERRRIESWLGDYMRFVRTPKGKTVFLSIDGRSVPYNPFYRAWKAKSFTNGEITLHFILFDILYAPEIRLSLPEIMEQIDGRYLCCFCSPMVFDESTVRKKLKEYQAEGLILTEKQGRTVFYRRAGDLRQPDGAQALHFFSETAPCGVIGSYLLDQREPPDRTFRFKHHYIDQALDSGVLAALFSVMRQKQGITARYFSRRARELYAVRLVPLRIFISVQNGRQHLLAYQPQFDRIRAFRLDCLSDVVAAEPFPRFDELRERLKRARQHMWGVNCGKDGESLEHVSFTLRIAPEEEHILRRLYREKRIGQVERLDEIHYRFHASVYDTGELIPWIRTFLCRITQLDFSNRAAERQFKEDLEAMYRLYGIDGDGLPTTSTD